MHKKSVKLEVNDMQNLLGTIQSIPITISAEAYNVAIDLHFPKGSGTALSLGNIRVFEENRQQLQLRNRGRYAMNFSFIINKPKLFTILPSSGSVAPSDKPQSITVIFKSGEEIVLNNSNEIYCLISDPHTNQLIAKVSNYCNIYF